MAGLMLGGSASAQLVLNKYAAVKSLSTSTAGKFSNKLLIQQTTSMLEIGVLIIQMKGADIKSKDDSSFGRVTNYGNSGNYEFATLTRKIW